VDLVPTTSTTTTLAVSDALAIIVMEERGFSTDEFAYLHPGGVIGHLASKRVEDVMHRGDHVPRISTGATLRDALVEIVRARLGMTTVVDGGGGLMGIITDGDLKRILLRNDGDDEGRMLDMPVTEVMSTTPATIEPDAPLVRALARMENNPGGAITNLVVLLEGNIVGVVHIHDCVRP
jgi:arabinose-5-phosphate isomerase